MGKAMRGSASTKGGRGRRALAAGLGALLCAAAVALPADAQRGSDQTMQVSYTGLGAEMIKTAPIGRNPGSKTRVAMSLPPEEVGPVNRGDAVWAGAELEISVTCLELINQCLGLGRLYDYSPFIRVRLVLAPSPTTAGESNTTPISDWKKIQCSQDLPHRNHHCVLAVDGTNEIKGSDTLACDRCHVNLLVDAYHGSAALGNLIVIGSDGDHGIQQDKSTLNAAVWNPGPRPNAPVAEEKKLSTHKIPVAAQNGSGGKQKVVVSRRLDELKAGEQLLIEARAKVKTDHLPYGTLLQSQVVLSEQPGSIKRAGTPGKIASLKGMITAQNGFNCTRGHSGHTSPCTVRKLGVVKIFKDARTNPTRGEGPFVPLYVNLVMQSKAEFGGERHRSGDKAKVLSGSVKVTRFGPQYRR